MTTTTTLAAAPELDSTEAFRWLWFNWRMIGMDPPVGRWRHAYNAYAVAINIFGPFCFPASLLANLLFVQSLEELLANLSLSITIAVASFKQLAIWYYSGLLKRVRDPLGSLDARCSDHPIDRGHIVAAIRTCRRFYASYVFFYIFCASGFAYIGYTNHQLTYNGWFPHLLRDPEANYLLAFSYQTVAVSVTILQNTNNDMYPQCYVAMMIGHVRALAVRIERVGRDPLRSVEENFEELLRCIQDHKNVLRYFECIRPVISSTIFMQFLITALVLCLTAINFIAFERDLAQMIVLATYLLVILIEVFPCCWYVNILMDESDRLTTAMYKCNWYEQDNRFRKTLIIFMQRSQKTNVIMAGNLASVTLQTFVAVIKFAFSMFTILIKMKT